MAGAPLIGTAFIAAGAGADRAGAAFMAAGTMRIGRAARLGGVAALLIGGTRMALGSGARDDGGRRRIGVRPRPRFAGIGPWALALKAAGPVPA